MTTWLDGWEARCASSGPLRFVDRNLRGIGQVMFQNHPLSGLLFFIAISLGSWSGGVPEVAVGGLVALLAGTLMAQWLRVEEADLNAGLFGFNAYLVGLALPTFMATSWELWIYIVIGGALSVVFTLAFMRFFKTWGIPALTGPFVLITWFLLLGSNAFSGLQGNALPEVGTIVAIDPKAANPLQIGDFFAGLLASISQVFLKGHWIAAVLLVAGLAVSSVASAVLAVFGAVVGLIAAHVLGAESQLITAGLLGFNPVLTAIALGAVFYQPSVRVIIYALLATVLSVIVHGALMTAMVPFGIPALTASFVLVTWLFLLPAIKFD